MSEDYPHLTGFIQDFIPSPGGTHVDTVSLINFNINFTDTRKLLLIAGDLEFLMGNIDADKIMFNLWKNNNRYIGFKSSKNARYFFDALRNQLTKRIK